jgi:hypothetical protein
MSMTTSRRAVFVIRRGLSCVCAVAFAAAVAACGDSARQTINPVGPSAVDEHRISTSGTGSTVEQSVARHVAGTLDGRFDFTRTWGSEWWEFYSDSDCTGTVSHLGLTRLRTTHIPTMTGALTQGEFTMTAANGDEIRGTYEGTFASDPDHPAVYHATAMFVVASGTGRFAGATGSLTAVFVETLDDPSWASAAVTWTLAGTIAY